MVINIDLTRDTDSDDQVRLRPVIRLMPPIKCEAPGTARVDLSVLVSCGVPTSAP